MLPLIISGLVVIFSLNVFAQESDENPLVADMPSTRKKVVYFTKFQTVTIDHLSAGDLQLQVAAGIITQKVAAESSSSSPIVFTIDNSATGVLGGAAVRYGISDKLSVGSDFTYSQVKSETTTTVSGAPSDSADNQSGIQDIALRGQLVVDFNSFGYAANLRYLPTIGKASSNSQTEESNSYREQSILGLQNYLVFNTANIKWGGVLTYDYAFDGEVESISSSGITSNRTVSGRNTLTAGGFVEFETLFKTNLTLNYQKVESGTRTTQAGVVTDVPELTYLNFVGSVKLNINQKWSIVPQFQYATVLNKDADPTFSYTQVDIFGVSTSLRMNF